MAGYVLLCLTMALLLYKDYRIIKLEAQFKEELSMTTITSFAHNLGVKAKDPISGFEGIITARAQHMFGCSTYGLAPTSLGGDGQVKKTEYFDESRIEILDNGIAPEGQENCFDKIFLYPMGKEAKDKLTGLSGKIVYRVEYLHGCNGIGLLPVVDKDGKTRESELFDEGRIEIIGEGIDPTTVQTPKRGALTNREAPRF